METNEKQLELYQNILYIVNEMSNTLSCDKKLNENLKEDGEYLINLLKQACNDNNDKYMFGFILSLNYFAKEVKSLRFLAKELTNIVIKYLE